MIHLVTLALLAFLAVTAIGGAILAQRARSQGRLRSRLGVQQAAAPAPPETLGVLARLGRAVSSGKYSTKLQEGLARAGFYNRTAPFVFLGGKILLLMLGLGGLLLLLGPTRLGLSVKAPLILIGTGLMFFLPNMIVDFYRRRRSLDVRHSLPDAVDHLEICLSSGMSLDMAWNLVTEEIRRVSSVLADEMALTNLEIHLGASRVAAMRHMVDRTGAEELGSLVAVLVQSERFGTSLSDALRTFAASMRENRTLVAEEVAEKMAVKLLFPMVLFVFPAVLIVAVGPAAITLAHIMLQH